jgi:hypothetical protein
MKLLEQLAMNYLLKRGYQVTLPKVYFSGVDFKAVGGATYWKPDKKYIELPNKEK